MQSRLEDSSGYIDWEALESKVGPHALKSSLLTMIFEMKQRLNSKKYDTVLNTFTALHTISLNIAAQLRELLADDVLEARFKSIQAGRSNTLAAALAQLLLDWSYIFGQEALGTRYKQVQDLLRPRAISGIRPTAVATAYKIHGASLDPVNHVFWRGFDFSQFLAKPGERAIKTGTSQGSQDPSVEGKRSRRSIPVPAAPGMSDVDRQPVPSPQPQVAQPQRAPRPQPRAVQSSGKQRAEVQAVAEQRGERDADADKALNALERHTGALVQLSLQLEQAQAKRYHHLAQIVLAKGDQVAAMLEEARAKARALGSQASEGAKLKALRRANEKCTEHMKRWKRLVIKQPVAPISTGETQEVALLDALALVRNASAACSDKAGPADGMQTMQNRLGHMPALKLSDTFRISQLVSALGSEE